MNRLDQLVGDVMRRAEHAQHRGVEAHRRSVDACALAQTALAWICDQHEAAVRREDARHRRATAT